MVGNNLVGALFVSTSKLNQRDAAVLCDAIHIHTVCKMRVVLF